MKIAISGYVGNKLTGIGRVLIEVLKELAPMNLNDEYVLFKNFDFEDYDVLKVYPNIKFVDIDVSKNNSFIIRKTKCYRFTKRNVPKRKTKRLRYRCPPEPYSNSVRTDFFSYSNAIILENQQINTSI